VHCLCKRHFDLEFDDIDEATWRCERRLHASVSPCHVRLLRAVPHTNAGARTATRPCSSTPTPRRSQKGKSHTPTNGQTKEKISQQVYETESRFDKLIIKGTVVIHSKSLLPVVRFLTLSVDTAGLSCIYVAHDRNSCRCVLTPHGHHQYTRGGSSVINPNHVAFICSDAAATVIPQKTSD